VLLVPVGTALHHKAWLLSNMLATPSPSITAKAQQLLQYNTAQTRPDSKIFIHEAVQQAYAALRAM